MNHRGYHRKYDRGYHRKYDRGYHRKYDRGYSRKYDRGYHGMDAYSDYVGPENAKPEEAALD